jgi:hypothetical protein
VGGHDPENVHLPGSSCRAIEYSNSGCRAGAPVATRWRRIAGARSGFRGRQAITNMILSRQNPPSRRSLEVGRCSGFAAIGKTHSARPGAPTVGPQPAGWMRACASSPMRCSAVWAHVRTVKNVGVCVPSQGFLHPGKLEVDLPRDCFCQRLARGRQFSGPAAPRRRADLLQHRSVFTHGSNYRTGADPGGNAVMRVQA